MPSNEQRREAAKRKLERQLERRAERARKRKQMTIAGTALGVVVVVGVVGGLIWLSNRSDDDANTTNTAADDSSLTPQTAGAMPAGLSTPLADTVSCSYPPTALPRPRPTTLLVPTGFPPPRRTRRRASASRPRRETSGSHSTERSLRAPSTAS